MLNLLKIRKQHGFQTINNIRETKILSTFRGFPIIEESNCDDNGEKAKNLCPLKAIDTKPLRIDLGKCTFCGECEKIYPNKAIKFTTEYRIGSTSKAKLIVTTNSSFKDYNSKAIKIKKEIHKLFGRSLKLRMVSAAGCSGCELELAATLNVNFDMGRFGVDFVASPRHADGLVFTGPISNNMVPALMDAYKSISTPKIVISVGTCAISGGLFAESSEINRTFLNDIKVDLYIPGCPPHPLTIINAILDFLGKK